MTAPRSTRWICRRVEANDAITIGAPYVGATARKENQGVVRSPGAGPERDDDHAAGRRLAG